MSSVWTDLHGHTFYSDGLASPGAYARARAEAQVPVIAVADHDHFGAVRAVHEAAAPLGLTVFPAAELTALLHPGTDRVEQLHVLAYFPPSFLEGDRLERTALFRRGLEVQEAWRRFVLDYYRSLDQAGRWALGGPALELVPAPDFPGLQSLIDRLAHRNPALTLPFRRHHVHFWYEHEALFGWTPEALIDAIRADGGFEVVAHPVRYKDKARLTQVLHYARGVEVYTSRHRPNVAARFRAWAEAHDKRWTASTDDHQRGPYQRPPVGTPVATLEAILGAKVPEAWTHRDGEEPRA